MHPVRFNPIRHKWTLVDTFDTQPGRARYQTNPIRPPLALSSINAMETERLYLLPWHVDDWTAFRPIAADPEVMRYITGGIPWDDDQIVAFIRRQITQHEEHGFCLWKLVEKTSSRLIGFCGLQPVNLEGVTEIEIGWWLARDRWGLGLATEAARHALADAVERSGVNRVIAIARPANAASRHVMEKLGMRYERDAVHKEVPVVVYSLFARPASV
jgi:RimJ/RimL family protein N-acetyltransferase